MNRRGFLGSILALGAAPAIVRADSLMRIIPREAAVLVEPAAWMEYVVTSVTGGEQIVGDFMALAEEVVAIAMPPSSSALTVRAMHIAHAGVQLKVGDRFTLPSEGKVGTTIRVRQPSLFSPRSS